MENLGTFAAAGSGDDAAERAHAPVAVGGQCRLGFWLFILVNATLFIRPAEIVESWEGQPIYQCLILACLLFSLPVVLPQLSWSSLRQNPITLCVLGLLPAIFLSQLSHGDFYDARQYTIEFSKIVIYYLLLVGLVDSPARLRAFLLITAGFVLTVATLAILNHHEFINIPALADMKQGYNEDLAPDEQGDFVVRLQAMGIFNDPNDFSLIINVAIFIYLNLLLDCRNKLAKIAWALPIAVLIYAMVLTQSRGGFLAFLAGVLAMAFTRLSRRRAILLCLVLLPAMFIAFSGRLTNMDVEDNNDTAQGRIQLWRDAMVEFHHAPLFGIGYGSLPDAIGLVAHNSYVHCYAELGFFGGTLFFGAFYLAFTSIKRLPVVAPHLGAELMDIRNCLFPVIAAYMTGIYSLSRPYGNGTYLILGVVAVLLFFSRAAGGELPQVTRRLARNLILASVGCIFYFEIFIRLFAH